MGVLSALTLDILLPPLCFLKLGAPAVARPAQVRGPSQASNISVAPYQQPPLSADSL